MAASSLVWSSGRYTSEWLTRLTPTHLCRPYAGSMAKEGNLNRLEATMVETLWRAAKRSATQFRSGTIRKLMLNYLLQHDVRWITPLQDLIMEDHGKGVLDLYGKSSMQFSVSISLMTKVSALSSLNLFIYLFILWFAQGQVIIQ